MNNEQFDDDDNNNEEDHDNRKPGRKKHKRNKEHKKRNINTVLGQVILTSGNYCIPINICNKPKEVILEVIEPEDGCQVCGHKPTEVGYALINTGFILFVEVKSNYVTIEWTAKF